MGLKIITLLILTACLGLACEPGQTPEPHSGEVAAPPEGGTLQGSGGPEVTSKFPPEVDPDQDGFVNAPIPNRPDLPVDNCPEFNNPDQEDLNKNNIGDACE